LIPLKKTRAAAGPLSARREHLRFFTRIFLLRTGTLYSRGFEMSFWRARLFTSIVAIGVGLGWVTATQHCLLSVVKADTIGPTCHCSDHCPGSGSQENGRMLACCQGLLSQALELVQSKIKYTPVVFRSKLTALDRLIDYEPPPAIGVDGKYDTGPPRENCFLETVLKRSLPQNAPPCFV
jgi:hypothetical protein